MTKNVDDIFNKTFDQDTTNTWIELLNLQIDMTFWHERWLYTNPWWHRAQRVIDAGCGTGYYLRKVVEVSENKHILGVDLQPALIAEAQRQNTNKGNNIRVDFRRASFTQVDEQGVDVVIARLLVQHLVDIDEFVAWARRTLQADGRLIIIEPIDGEEYYSPALHFYWECRQRLQQAEKNAKGDRSIQAKLADILRAQAFIVEENRKVTVPCFGNGKDTVYRARQLIPKLGVVTLTEPEQHIYATELAHWYQEANAYSHVTLRVIVAKNTP